MRHVFLILPGILMLTACGRTDNLLPYPHESTLSVIGELKIWLRSDPYREEPGKDLEGQNIYRATLYRLESMDELTDERYDDILGFARAECHERLGNWDAAGREFEKVAEAGTSLSEEASIRRIWVQRILEARREPPALENIEDYLDFLDAQLVQFEQLRRSGPMFPYDAYIMIELERVQEQKAAFLFNNRTVIPGGSKRGIETAEKLVQGHSASRRIGEHLLLLGGFHEQLARDYLRANPAERYRFQPDSWLSWVESAREQYQKAARRDGDPAKPEAQARLRSIEAWATRTLQLGR